MNNSTFNKVLVRIVNPPAEFLEDPEFTNPGVFINADQFPEETILASLIPLMEERYQDWHSWYQWKHRHPDELEDVSPPQIILGYANDTFCIELQTHHGDDEITLYKDIEIRQIVEILEEILSHNIIPSDVMGDPI